MPKQPKKTTAPREEELLLPQSVSPDGVPLIIATGLRPGPERLDVNTSKPRTSIRETRVKLLGSFQSDVSVIATEKCTKEDVKLVIARNLGGILELIVRAGIRTKKNQPTTATARLNLNDGKALDVKLVFDSANHGAGPKYVIDAAIIFGEWDFMDYLSFILEDGIMEPSVAPDVLSGIPDVQDVAVVELKDQFVCNATFSDDFQNDPLLLCAN